MVKVVENLLPPKNAPPVVAGLVHPLAPGDTKRRRFVGDDEKPVLVGPPGVASNFMTFSI